MSEVREVPPVADGTKRRSMLAGFVSLGGHGALVSLIFALTRGTTTASPPGVELVPIEIALPPPPAPPSPPPGSGGQQRSATSTSMGTFGRHGHGAPRSQSHAQVTADPHADLVVSYEALTSQEPGDEAGRTGLGFGWGLTGTGAGGGDGFGQFGLGNVPPPPPPPPPSPPLTPSLARPPVARFAYHTSNFRAATRFAGAIVRLELSIDPTGKVRHVRLLKGVDSNTDHMAMEMARDFEFYPALDAAGHPTWGLHRWEFVIGGTGNPSFHFR